MEDQWKVLPRLTLTGGLRYSYMPFANADQGFATSFSPAAFNPHAAPGVNQNGSLILNPAYNPLNGLIYNGLSGVPFNLSNAHQNYFSPSVGFAWDIYGNGRISIRGGYSVNYLKSGSSSDCQDSCIGLPAVTQINLTGANFPNPLGGKTTIPTATSTVFGEDIHGIQAAKIHSYSLSVQQQFGSNWLVEIAGAGVAGRNLPLELNINQPQPYQAFAYNPNLNLGGIANAYDAPYQGYGNINYATSAGIANWNCSRDQPPSPGREGTISFRARRLPGLTGLPMYPASKGTRMRTRAFRTRTTPCRTTEILSSINTWPSPALWSIRCHGVYVTGGWDEKGIRRLGVFRHRRFPVRAFVFCGTLHSKSRTRHSPRYESQCAAGTVQLGSHVQGFNGVRLRPTVPSSAPAPLSCRISTRPRRSALQELRATPSMALLETRRLTPFLAPGKIINNVAFLFKIFPIRDRLNLRVRGEAFNMVNHPNFSGMDLNLGDANFGTYTHRQRILA